MNPSRYVLFRSQIAPMMAPPMMSGLRPFPGPGPSYTCPLLSALGSSATLPSGNHSGREMWRRREDGTEGCGRLRPSLPGDRGDRLATSATRNLSPVRCVAAYASASSERAGSAGAARTEPARGDIPAMTHQHLVRRLLRSLIHRPASSQRGRWEPRPTAACAARPVFRQG